MKTKCSVRTKTELHNGQYDTDRYYIENNIFDDCELAMREFIAKKTEVESQDDNIYPRIVSVALVADELYSGE